MKTLWHKVVTPETVRYLIFGVLTTAVDALVYWFTCDLLHFHYLLANVLAWAISVLFAFVTNKLLVFDSRDRATRVWLRELALFLLARLFSLGLASLWLFITVDLFGMDELLSKLISYVFVVILNYGTGKWLVFRKKEN